MPSDLCFEVILFDLRDYKFFFYKYDLLDQITT